MINFIVQIIISVFIGWSFVYLAKKYQKSQVGYFCMGVFVCLAVRFIYLIIYGFITDFSITSAYSYHRNLSIILSVILSYIVFIIVRKYLEKRSLEHLEIENIGKE